MNLTNEAKIIITSSSNFKNVLISIYQKDFGSDKKKENRTSHTLFMASTVMKE